LKLKKIEKRQKRWPDLKEWQRELQEQLELEPNMSKAQLEQMNDMVIPLRL
jgi:hypothetical protein